MPPFRDLERTRAYQRAYQRQRNQQEATAFPGDLPRITQLRTAHDILDRIEAHLAAVEADEKLSTAQRARVARDLLAVALRAVEVTDLGGRLVRLEAVLKQHGMTLPVSPALLPAPDEGAEDTEVIS